MMESVAKTYDYVFNESADPRVNDWLFMSSPWPIAAIVITYLTMIKLVLPAYMRDRKAYDLRTVIKWYNIGQIVANCIICWGILTSGWTTTYHFGCLLPDYSTDPEPVRMLGFLWWTMMNKIAELVETAFFLLRKKEQQASFLHVYHHASTVMLMWCGVKYIGGGITTFPPMVNTAVHVIMYSYYLLSSEGSPKVKQYVMKHKMWLTILQMVQFTVLLIHSSQILLPSCPAPLGVAYMYFPNVIFVFYMFYDFFKSNYSKKTNKAQNGTNGSYTVNGSNGTKKSN